MEEKNGESMSIKGGLIVLGVVFVFGYFTGQIQSTKMITDSYNRGFMDAFETLISKSK